MGRKYVECRDFSGDDHCSEVLTGNNDEELMEAVIKHAINMHGMANTTDFRTKVSMTFKEGTPTH
ncbi:DUF1059 domain-containing protein [Geothermobacter hydrogeniphilus]|uniref:Small metal-binding protein n=1 Tax=Geothermobacter hydrogeniphilus TaxID=1969733 RepID=A0A1X0XK83_9BACT|nr:DUF1059 domain-containing protein [Geothermobacter hydrogeniphilus]ORJ53248.1 hypothetical protein B5V00_16445 [Geothermobacter hydrogeniphilus]